MKVKELIEHLKQLPEEAAVMVPESNGEESDWRDVETVEFSRTVTRNVGKSAGVVKLGSE